MLPLPPLSERERALQVGNSRFALTEVSASERQPPATGSNRPPATLRSQGPWSLHPAPATRHGQARAPPRIPASPAPPRRRVPHQSPYLSFSHTHTHTHTHIHISPQIGLPDPVEARATTCIGRTPRFQGGGRGPLPETPSDSHNHP